MTVMEGSDIIGALMGEYQPLIDLVPLDQIKAGRMTEAAGMGSAPLSWQSINAWQQSVRLRLAPWEARLIRKLSVEYLAEGRRAESENCPAPWHSAPTEQDREIELRALQSVLG